MPSRGFRNPEIGELIVIERGKLIAFEGGEASGKSTQAQLLAESLDATYTWEPGFTDLGSEIRKLLLNSNITICPEAEALLMTADRAQHVVSTINPLLDAGKWVVTDRYMYSTLAYQGAGRGLSAQDLYFLSYFAKAPKPDVVILLTVSPQEQLARLQAKAGKLDRFEQEGQEFHARVSQAFSSMAYKSIGSVRNDEENGPSPTWIVVSGKGPIDVVHQSIREQLARLFS